MPDTPRTVSEENAEFWNDLCGSILARDLGVTDHSPLSLKKYDEGYFQFYPYLTRHIPFPLMRGKTVLEVGLGFGSVAQRMAEAGAIYEGLDISRGPVAMVHHRFRTLGVKGHVARGNILNAPFKDSSFDYVIAIGSYHHTGDLQRAVDESFRLLKSGGTLVMMVYNAYSYRRWLTALPSTIRYFVWRQFRWGENPTSTMRQRAAYDSNTKGKGAPHTDFVSRGHLRDICHRFASFEPALENVVQEGPLKFFGRNTLLNAWPKCLGTDIYARAIK